MSYYQDLGVSPSASGEEIRDSYHTLVRLFHPDQQTDPALKLAAEAQMRRLNEIYATLSDPERRRHYNAELASANERLAPIIIHAPRPMPRHVRVPWGTIAWGSAVLASAALILWLSMHDVSREPPADGASLPPAPANRSQHVEPPARAQVPAQPDSAAAALAVIYDLQQQLRTANSQREDALRLLNQAQAANQPRPEPLHKRPDPALVAHTNASAPGAPPIVAPRPAPALPQPTAMEAPPSLPGTLNAAPLTLPVPSHSHLAGQWLWTKPRAENRNKALYPPEFIETTIIEQNGSLRGRYRARYQVADRAISPDVNFDFDGKAAGPSAQLAFRGEGGAKGEVRIKLISDNSIEVKWSATDLGKSLGLSAGTAVLVRRTE